MDAAANTVAEPVMSTALPVERAFDGRLYMDVQINDEAIRVMVDTAASHSVLRAEDARLANIAITGETRLRTAGGVVSAKEGAAEAILVAGHSLTEQRILIADDLPVSLLGMDILQTLEGVHIRL